MPLHHVPLPAESVLWVVSGAGISVESGLPTFRDADGLWGRFDINEVCNALTWKKNREQVFEFYRQMPDILLALSALRCRLKAGRTRVPFTIGAPAVPQA